MVTGKRVFVWVDFVKWDFAREGWLANEDAGSFCGARLADERDRGECVHQVIGEVAKETAEAQGGLRGVGALGDARQPGECGGFAENDPRFLWIPAAAV